MKVSLRYIPDLLLRAEAELKGENFHGRIVPSRLVAVRRHLPAPFEIDPVISSQTNRDPDSEFNLRHDTGMRMTC